MNYFVTMFEVFFKPRLRFNKIKKDDRKDIIFYTFFISLIFYIFYLAHIILKIRKNDLPRELIHFSFLFNKFNIWVVIYFLTLLVAIFLILLIITFVLSWIAKIILSIFKVKIRLSVIWYIMVYSFTPIIAWQLLVLISYILNFGVKSWVILVYVYILILIVIGIKNQIKT